MKVYLVRFTQFGFKLDAVVVAPSEAEAVALLKLTSDERFKDAEEIGRATGNLTPRVVTEDRL